MSLREAFENEIDLDPAIHWDEARDCYVSYSTRLVNDVAALNTQFALFQSGYAAALEDAAKFCDQLAAAQLKGGNGATASGAEKCAAAIRALGNREG